MSRENVEIVRRIYEAVATRDADRVLDLYDPAVVLDFTNSSERMPPGLAGSV